jgi:hypothetical protein
MLSKFLKYSGWFALLLLLVSGIGHRLQLWGHNAGFSILLVAVVIGLVTVLAIVVLLFLKKVTSSRNIILVSGVIGLLVVFIPAMQMIKVSSLPLIHDISTDINNPPVFVEVIALRKEADNSIEYAGLEVGLLQVEAYPDIQTITVKNSLAEVFNAALAGVDDLGWDLVGSNLAEGRIEATATTFWFGFKDDIVIRLRAVGEQTLVDVRSKSRVGKSDVGANAERIRHFTKALLSRL